MISFRTFNLSLSNQKTKTFGIYRDSCVGKTYYLSHHLWPGIVETIRKFSHILRYSPAASADSAPRGEARAREERKSGEKDEGKEKGDHKEEEEKEEEETKKVSAALPMEV